MVGTILAYAATALQPLRDENVRKEKMQNILATVGIETTRDGSEALYNQYVKEAYALNEKGEVIEGADAFKIDLAKELKKPANEQSFPIYIAEIEGCLLYTSPSPRD